MIKSFFRVTTLLLAVTGTVHLAGCGGGSSDTSSSTDTSGSSAVTALKITDTVVGTGALAGPGNKLTVTYTGWLYNVNATSYHGTQFDSNVGGTAFTFTLGAGQVITGWDAGLTGMQVGGKRTLIIPSSLAYGASGNGTIPANAALVFDVQLNSMQ
ncbi:FKBP-type peptidyl-prolyl cis-trans isomerase [Roseateles koreensis]|nr:FKBP-type peptidyl-prolyl cis-trans isomerase [Roseateles koreensis]